MFAFIYEFEVLNDEIIIFKSFKNALKYNDAWYVTPSLELKNVLRLMKCFNSNGKLTMITFMILNNRG